MKSLFTLLSIALPVCLLPMIPPDVSAADDSAGGKSEMKVEHVDAEGAAKLIADKKVVVIDVRTPEEYQAGHIAGAKLINFRSNSFVPTLEKMDKNQTYLIHCAAGSRSTRSLSAFKRLEFKSIVHLDGGFMAWEKAGKPVEK